MADTITVAGLEVPAHPEAGVDFDHADLQFHQVDHSGHSYEVRVYLNNHDATEKTGRDPATGYAGSFYVFGHGGCFGEEGHCEVRQPVSTFDRRLPHQLVPANRVLICTELIQGLIQSGRTVGWWR